MTEKRSVKTIAFIILAIVIVAVYFSYFKDLNTFYVFDDEFGYWSNGALIAGYDWSESLLGCAYYSYGYGVLLAPIIKNFDDPSIMYQAAIFLNVIMGCAIFIIAFLCFRSLYKETGYYKQLIVAATISVYSGYTMNIHIAWAETLLNLVFWILIYLLILYFTTNKFIYMLSSVIVSGYALMVHPRAICVFVAILILVLFLQRQKVLTRKQFLWSILTWFITIIIWYGLKQYFKMNLWKYGTEINDFSGEFQKISLLFTPKGFFTFFQYL